MNPLYTSETNIFKKNNFGPALYMQTSRFFSLSHALKIAGKIVCIFIISLIAFIVFPKVFPASVLGKTWFKLFESWILMLPIIAAVAEAHSTIKIVNSLRYYDKREKELEETNEVMSLRDANLVFQQRLYCTGIMVVPFIIVCCVSMIMTHDMDLRAWWLLLFYIILNMTYAFYFKTNALPKEEEMLRWTFIDILKNEALQFDELIDCSAIVARNAKNYIGKNGKLMYKLPKDMNNFKKLTTCYGHGIVIMGRKTWESLGCKPLLNRTNIVVTKQKKVKCTNPEFKPIVAKSIEEAIAYAYTENFMMYHVIADNIWIIGGSSIYEAAMRFTRNIYVTLVCDETEGDTTMVFPKYDFIPAFMSESIQDGDYVTYQQIFVRRNKEVEINGDTDETIGS